MLGCVNLCRQSEAALQSRTPEIDGFLQQNRSLQLNLGLIVVLIQLVRLSL